MSDTPLRVAIAIPAFRKAPDFGGPVSKVALLAQALATRGHDVTVLTADYGPGRSRIAPQTITEDGFDARYLRTAVRYRWTSVLAPGALRAVPWDFDIVHVCGLRDGVGAAVIRSARKHGTPYVLEPMGMAPARLRNALLKTVFDRLLTEKQLRAAASVIATSEAERAALVQHYGLARVDVRPNPLARATTTPSTRVARGGEPLELLFVGRICRTKNLPALVDAVAAIDDVRLTIAGPDDRDGTSDTLRAMTSSLPDRVVVRGWVSLEERDQLIAASDVCVLPSITENFGNFAVEGASGRRPVIVTRPSGVAEFLEGAALIVEPTTAALREAIVRLASDADLRASLADAGYARAADLAPAKVAAAQEAIYRNALRSVDHDHA
jgi:glycosyltransferase involved in cell wall biosynthesis